jgi:hypothetical protein
MDRSGVESRFGSPIPDAQGAGIMVTTALIDDAEERLRRAVLANDVKAIGDLLSPALVFTDQSGRRLNKIDSLIAHSSGSLRIRSMTIEDFETRLMGSCAVVTVTASVGGKLDGAAFEARYAYTRIWEHRDGRCMLAAAHCSSIA